MLFQTSFRFSLPYSANKHICNEATAVIQDYERIATTNNTMKIHYGASVKKLHFNNSKQ